MGDLDKVNDILPLEVLIPYHSRIDYLQEAVSSLVAQSSTAWRAIIVDDSDTEGAEQLVRDLNDSRIRYVCNVHPSGMASNWNFAVSLVQSELFCLLHADDVLEPGYVKAMLECAENHPAAAAFFCHVRLINENGERVFSFPDWVKTLIEGSAARRETIWQGEVAAAQLLKGCFIFCPTVVYRKSRVPLQPFESNFGQVLDLDLYLRLVLQGEQLVGLPQKLYRYRRHSQNATALQTQNLSRFSEEFALYESMSRVLASQGWMNAAKVAERKRILFLHVGYRMIRDLCGFKIGAVSEKMRFLIRQLNKRATV